MRWLVVHPGPSFSVQDVYDGWVDGLRECGETVHVFNLGDRLNAYGNALIEIGQRPSGAIDLRRMYTPDQTVELAVNGLYAALYKVRPDVLLIVSAFYVPHELLELARKRGTAVILLHTESPYADMNLLNDPIHIEDYLAVGQALYLPHAYRPDIHHPGPPVEGYRSDFAFVGTAFKSRVEFFEELDLAGLDVLLAGNWSTLDTASPLAKHVAHDLADCLDNVKTADVYRSARAGLNLYRREAQNPDLVQGLAMGPREVEMAACGLFFLRDPRPEGDAVLAMLPTFTGAAEASELLRWWLAHEDARIQAAAAARAAVSDRTFRNHAAALLRRIEP
jgi:spore maturation protein CgeB